MYNSLVMKLLIMRHGETFWNTEGRLQGQTDIPLDENGIRMAISCGEGMKEVPIDLCISSTLIRAAQTAELCLFPNRGYAKASEALIEALCESKALTGPHRKVVTAPSERVVGSCVREYGAFSGENRDFVNASGRKVRYLTGDRLVEAGFGPWEGLICRGKDYNVPLENFGTYWSDPESPLIDPDVERLTQVADRVEGVLSELFACELLKDKTILLIVHGCVIRSIFYLMNGKKRFTGKVPLNCEVIYAHPDPDAFLAEDGREIFCDRSMLHDYYADMVQE